MVQGDKQCFVLSRIVLELFSILRCGFVDFQPGCVIGFDSEWRPGFIGRQER